MHCTSCNADINNPRSTRTLCIKCYYENKILKLRKKRAAVKKKVVKENRVCASCAKPFESKYKIEKFCCVECRNHLANRKANESWVKQEAPVKKEKNHLNLHKKERKTSFNRFPLNLPRETYEE